MVCHGNDLDEIGPFEIDDAEWEFM